MTTFTKAQLATILSALDDKPRNPSTKDAALKAIAKAGKRFGLTTEDILGVAPGLLDGRMSPAEFRTELHDMTDPDDGAVAATDAQAPEGAAIPAPEAASADTGADTGANSATPAPTGTGTGTGKRVKKTRANTKQVAVIDLLRRGEGATIAQVAEITGWQNHTVRGFFAGALKKKLGLAVTSEKVDGARVYHIAEEGARS